MNNDNMVTVDNGYTVIYDKFDGTIGFIGIDTHSGGYPYFSDRIESGHVYREIAKAFGLLRSSKKDMKTYHGNHRVKFDTMRVVRYHQVFQEVNENEDKIFFDQTIKKLSTEELNILKRHWTGKEFK